MLDFSLIYWEVDVGHEVNLVQHYDFLTYLEENFSCRRTWLEALGFEIKENDGLKDENFIILSLLLVKKFV